MYMDGKPVEFKKAQLILAKASTVGKIAQKELQKLSSFMKE